jgi:hypothetical protein
MKEFVEKNINTLIALSPTRVEERERRERERRERRERGEREERGERGGVLVYEVPPEK